MLRWRMCLGTLVLFLLLLATFLFTLGTFQRLEMELAAKAASSAGSAQDIQLRQTLARVQERLDQVSSVVLVCLIASGLVALLTFRRFGRAVLDPLETIVAQVEAMEHQGFRADIEARAPDELGRLARAINTLAARIRSLLKESGERLATLARGHYALLRALPTPVFLLGADDRLVELNPAAESLLHRLGAGEALPPVLQRLLARARRSGQHVLPERLQDAIYLRAGTDELYFLPRILHLRHPDGTAIAESTLAVVLLDVTRYRWLDGMKTSQLATVSHELKTPLTSIRIMLHLLLERKYGELSPSQHEMLQTAMEDCERLLRTLNNLLDLSRMEAGSEQMILRPLRPEALLESCGQGLREAAAARALDIQVDCAPGLPDVAADEARFPLALANLAANAAKFARHRIRLSARPTEGGVRFLVEDDGPGVSEDYRGRIFERFFRIPGQSQEGVGLGLSIAREIVRAHGGHIAVGSAPEGGAAFHIDLAAAASAAHPGGGKLADSAPDLRQAV